MIAPAVEAFVPLDQPIDLRLTLAPLAHGRGDPTIQLRTDGVWRAWRTVAGPATLRLRSAESGLAAAAWGPGADTAIAGLPDLVGMTDEPDLLVPRHAVLVEVLHRHPGLRLPRTNAAWEALLPAICEQKVTGVAAREAYRGIIGAYGEPAPGPGRLWLVPEPSVLAGLPYFTFHRYGLERRRADVLRRAAAEMPRLASLGPTAARRRLAAIPGIGPWTMAEVARVAWGDPDAVSIGDYHIPSLVAFALAGERRADDARMLALLEPYRGQRGRVQRLLEVSGIGVPRRGPRLAPQRIAHL